MTIQRLTPPENVFVFQSIPLSESQSESESESQSSSPDCGSDHSHLKITLSEGIQGTPLIDQCAHYERHCSLVAPCCNRIYVCHRCHDANEDHEIDRQEVTEIICRHCHTRQKLGRFCQGCQIEFAKY